MANMLKDKPNVPYKKWSWEQVQTFLDNTFSHSHVKKRSRKFELDQFDIDKDVFISELESAGYTVSISEDGKSITVT